MRAAACALALTLVLSACAEGGKKPDRPSDWEVKNERLLKEEDNAKVPEPPPYPGSGNLVKFFVTAASDNVWFVDRTSVQVSDGIVRYVVVARSASGVDNVSFEALNCREREFRTYARGSSDGKWISRPTAWRKIEPRVHRAQYTLHWEYLCPNRIAVSTAAEGVMALQKGGHPWSKLPETW